ncbi:unnamed protein product, partial [Mesorhabditis spiculigera]
MQQYMPEICWHDRKGILSVDFHPLVKDGRYRIATSSMQKEVRIWEFGYVMPRNEHVVAFLANMACHNTSINVVRFAPVATENLLASGDSEGRIVIWSLSDQPPAPTPDDDMPVNKENWVRQRVLNHEEDVSALVWSPDGKMLASVGHDCNLLVHEVSTGKRTICLRNLRNFPNGITWDPRGKYLITLSKDRKMDILDCVKGTKLKAIAMAELPARSIGGLHAEAKPYRLWHDDQLASFQRGLQFSPCAAQLEVGTQDVFGVWIFKRTEIDKEKPFALLPTEKATFVVRMCPVIFKLVDGEKQNYSGLPYRIIWVALTVSQIYFFDSQHMQAIGYIDNIHYNSLTDASWSSDGQQLVVSSLEGYNSFFRLTMSEWGEVLADEQRPPPPPSPQLIKVRKRKVKTKEEAGGDEERSSETDNALSQVMTQGTPKHETPKTPKTPKAKRPAIASTPTSTPKLTKFFPRPQEKTAENNEAGAAQPEPQVVTIGDEQTDNSASTAAKDDDSSVQFIEVRRQRRVELKTLEP